MTASKRHQTKKELQEYIELLYEVINEGDCAMIDLIEAQGKYKKRYGKEYEY